MAARCGRSERRSHCARGIIGPCIEGHPMWDARPWSFGSTNGAESATASAAGARIRSVTSCSTGCMPHGRPGSPRWKRTDELSRTASAARRRAVCTDAGVHRSHLRRTGAPYPPTHGATNLTDAGRARTIRPRTGLPPSPTPGRDAHPAHTRAHRPHRQQTDTPTPPTHEPAAPTDSRQTRPLRPHRGPPRPATACNSPLTAALRSRCARLSARVLASPRGGAA